MRIMVVHNRYRSTSPSGEDRVVDQEHAALVAAGHEVERFERSSDAIAEWPLRRKALVPVRVVWNRGAATALDGALAAFRPDVVHLHNVFPLLSPSVLRSCERGRVPCVVTLHNYQLLCPSGLLYRTGSTCRECVGRSVPAPGVRHGCYRGSSVATVPLAASLLAHRRDWATVPSAYLFLSDVQRRALAPLGLPPSRCFVKHNFVPAATAPSVPEGLVVYLGRLTEAKGLHVLMREWDRFVAMPASAGQRLAIAGTGPLEVEVRRWAAARPSVEVLGLVDRDGCDRLLGRATAVVVPSTWQEPFGLVVAEAMAAGVPTVAPAHGSFEELITDGVDGLLYSPGDDGALARQLERVAGSPDWARGIGDAARETHARRFSPGAVTAQLEAAYRFAVANPRWVDAAGERSPDRAGAHQHAGRAVV